MAAARSWFATVVRRCAPACFVLLSSCSDNNGITPLEPPVLVETGPPPVTLTEEEALRAAFEESVDEAIVPSVQDFAQEATATVVSAQDFCGQVDEAGLRELQERWRSLFSRWYRLVPYNFGPLNDDIIFPNFTFIDSLRLRGTDYLETVRGEIARDISGDRELTEDYFARKTFNRVGLLALEATVFETSTAEHSQAATDILAEFDARPRKCRVLIGLARQIEERAQTIASGWLEEFQDTESAYRDLFLQAELEDGTEPISQLLIAVQEYLDYLQARRVVTTAAPLSGIAWDAVAASMDEVELLLRGVNSESNSFFDAMIASGNQNAVDGVEDSIDQIRRAIADRDPDMLEITLGFLDGNFKREIPDSLGIELGINFSDGD
ncbi:MAG: imelysin family protein [Pseudomonadota bacterium]